jgi:hypothetical protein
MKGDVLGQFGGARLLTSRLARTLAPPKSQLTRYQGRRLLDALAFGVQKEGA